MRILFRLALALAASLTLAVPARAQDAPPRPSFPDLPADLAAGTQSTLWDGGFRSHFGRSDHETNDRRLGQDHANLSRAPGSARNEVVRQPGAETCTFAQPQAHRGGER